MSEQKTERYMRAYFHTFDPTGNDAVDAILEAIAMAGKAFHNTISWDEADEYGPAGYWSLIQSRANDAAAALAAPPVPAGYKVVPVEPTPEMMDAAEACSDDWPRTTWRAAWSAMLAAAPTMLNGLTESAAPAQQNQCDGCMAGMPLERGFHRDKDGRPVQSCERSRYEPAPAQQAVTELADDIQKLGLTAHEAMAAAVAWAAPAPPVEAQADKLHRLAEVYAQWCDDQAVEEMGLNNDPRVQHYQCMADTIRRLAAALKEHGNG